MKPTKAEAERDLQSRWRGTSGRTTLPRSIYEKDDLDVFVENSEEVHETRRKADLKPGDSCQVLDIGEEGDTGLWFECTLDKIANGQYYGNFGKKKSWNSRAYERRHVRPAIIRPDYQLPRRHPNAAAFQALIGAVRFDRVQLCTGEMAFILVNDTQCYKFEVILNKKVQRLSYLKCLAVFKKKLTNPRMLPSEAVYTTQRSPSIGPVKRKLSEFLPLVIGLKTSTATEESAQPQLPRLSTAQKQSTQKATVKRRARQPGTAAKKKRSCDTRTDDTVLKVEPSSQRELFTTGDMAISDDADNHVMPVYDPQAVHFSAKAESEATKSDAADMKPDGAEFSATATSDGAGNETVPFCDSEETTESATLKSENAHIHAMPFCDPKGVDYSAGERLISLKLAPFGDYNPISKCGSLVVDEPALSAAKHYNSPEPLGASPALQRLHLSNEQKFKDGSAIQSTDLEWHATMADIYHFKDSVIRQTELSPQKLETDMGDDSMSPTALLGRDSLESTENDNFNLFQDDESESQQLLPFNAGLASTPKMAQSMEEHLDDDDGLRITLSFSGASAQKARSNTGDITPLTPSAVSRICSLAKLDLSSASSTSLNAVSPTDSQLKVEPTYDFEEDDELELDDLADYRLFKGEKPIGSRVALMENSPGCIVWFNADINLVSEPMTKLAVRKGAMKPNSIDRLYVFMNSLLHQICRKLPRPYLFGTPPLGKFSQHTIPTAVADEQPPPFREIINAAITKYNVRESQSLMFRRAVYTIIHRIKKNKRNQKHHHLNKKSSKK